jgi:pilus assembly protein Flp/PilA
MFAQYLLVTLQAHLARNGARTGERGQGMVEYALILVLISVVVIVIIQTVGHQVKNVFSNISSGLGT